MTTNKIVTTEDGSHSLFNTTISEHYHSVHGAMQESEHIFIGTGLKSIAKKEIHILEIGFGTGLNALLTYNEAKKSMLKIHYTALEKYPITDSIFSELNYPEILNIDNQKFLMMHRCEWSQNTEIDRNFILKKVLCDIRDAIYTNKFDLVYFDLFSPGKQAELWTDKVIRNIAESVENEGIFVTYSANGNLKRILESSGFKVSHLPGPPGKRVFTKAVKI